MNAVLFIAKRYLLTKSKNNVINIISLLATSLIIVVTAVFFILLSGFSGLKNFSLKFYNAADPDLVILPAKGKTFIYNDSIDHTLRDKRILSYSKVLEQRAFFHYKDKEHIAYLRGVDDHYTRVVRMDTCVFAGNWLQKEMPYGIVAGNGVASKLSLGIDFIEPVKVYVPKPGLTYSPDVKTMISSIKTVTIGIFSLLEELDGNYVYIRLPAIQELLGYEPERISAIHIALQKNTYAGEVAGLLKNKLGNRYKVKTRIEMNEVFYRMLNNENLLLYFISTLLLIMALFNIIGTIIMMIIDKRENLNTLTGMGFTEKKLRKIFVIQGFLLTSFGMLAGLMTGILLILLQKNYHFVKINPVMPYPVAFRWSNVALVVATILILGWISARIASSRINKRLLENR